MNWKIISSLQPMRDWLLMNHHPRTDLRSSNSNRPLCFFVIAVIAYCLYLLATQPEWVLGGEMWAESATNYFYNSSSSSLAVKFLSTDTGYVPLPQRLLAALGYALQLPAAAIPYFYTWSGILFTAGMVGVFCLAPFRALVKSDLLRLLAVLAVLMIADFESRSFINFTYFTAFFVAIISALAFVEKSSEVPAWAWLMPILMVSKPAVLAALPPMIAVALVSRARFRLITVVTTLFCLAQIINLVLNPAKDLLGAALFSTADKLLASVVYFLGFLGAFVTGMADSPGHFKLFFTGLGVLIASFVTVWKTRSGAGALVLIGLMLLLFNVAVHCFALTGVWNIRLQRLDHIELERHIIVGYFGVILVVTGLIAAVSESWSKTRTTHSYSWVHGAGPAIFFAWFCLAGWLTLSGSLNRQPGPPRTNISQWQTMSAAIDSGEPVCVPVDPFGMMYKRNCADFNDLFLTFMSNVHIEFSPTQMQDGRSVMDATLPPTGQGKKLLSVSIMLKPQSRQPTALNVTATLTLKDGTVKYLTGSRQLPAAGGMVMLTGKGMTPTSDIQQVTFSTPVPIDAGYLVNEDKSVRHPAIYWMGN